MNYDELAFKIPVESEDYSPCSEFVVASVGKKQIVRKQGADPGSREVQHVRASRKEVDDVQAA